MKYINIYTVVIAFFILGCSEPDDSRSCIDNIPCVEDCLEQVISQEGIVDFYSCYSMWGVSYIAGNNEPIHILIPDLNEDFHIEEATIMITGNYYENDLPLLIQDPMPGIFYVADLCHVIEKLN